MLVVSETDPNGDLILTAYSFDPKELQSLAQVTGRAGASAQGVPVPRDSHGRDGLRYTVPKQFVAKLGEIIGGTFAANGAFERVSGPGDSYACEEIRLHGRSGDCQTIRAVDMPAARSQCGLVARSRGWFGGVPRPGSCP
jgi:hypothetical protein